MVGNKESDPLITFAIFAFNQDKYIREAIEGAFAQDYTPLEIIISDDCSTDHTFEIMQHMVDEYSGPNVVRLNRNADNLGLIAHVNKIFELANGDWIVAAAGDDISYSHRTRHLVDAYRKSEGEPMLIHSNVMKIDKYNNEMGEYCPPIITGKMELEEIALAESLYIGASGAWSKKLYEHFGPVEFSRAYEDLVFGFRAALTDAILYVDESLVRYRVDVGVARRVTGSKDRIRRSIRKRKSDNLMCIDVFKQRISDMDKFEGEPDDNISRLLERALSYQLARRLLFQSPAKAMMSIFSTNSITMLKVIAFEIRYLIFGVVAASFKFCKNRFGRERKSLN